MQAIRVWQAQLAATEHASSNFGFFRRDGGRAAYSTAAPGLTVPPMTVHLLENRLADLLRELRLFLERLLRRIAPLADGLSPWSSITRALLLQYAWCSCARSRSEPEFGDALVVHNVELALGERRGDLVLHRP